MLGQKFFDLLLPDWMRGREELNMNIASTSLPVRGGSVPRKDLPGAAREGRIQSSHRFPYSYPGTIRKLKYRQNQKKETHLLVTRKTV